MSPVPQKTAQKGGGGLNRLCLDLGTKTGWASCVDGAIESGVQDFSLKRGESPGMRWLLFKAWMLKMLDEVVRPQLVVYEQPHHRGGAATHLLVGMATRVEEYCAPREIDHAPVHSATLKKFATGSGRASKEQMVKQANNFLWLKEQRKADITSDDEADALCLLFYSLKEWPDE